jgi:hypothetical protein
MERKGEREEFVRIVCRKVSTRLVKGEEFREDPTCRGFHKIMIYAGEHTEALYCYLNSLT